MVLSNGTLDDLVQHTV